MNNIFPAALTLAPFWHSPPGRSGLILKRIIVNFNSGLFYTDTLGIVKTKSFVYSINININTRDGKSVTGYYKGPLSRHWFKSDNFRKN